MKLQFSRQAECELDRIQEYYERKTGSSQRIVGEFDEAFEHLKRWPRTGQHRSELLGEPYRFWRVSSYLVVYSLDDPWLIVVTILHASRDIEKDLDWLR